MHHPTDRITHTTAFVTPVVEHWLEREIAHRNMNEHSYQSYISLKLFMLVETITDVAQWGKQSVWDVSPSVSQWDFSLIIFQKSIYFFYFLIFVLNNT